MTFSTMLRDYVYLPSHQYLLTRNLSRSAAQTLAYLITFCICGLWHGSSWGYLVWGLWNGVGLSIRRLYRNATSPILQRMHGKAKTLYLFGSWMLTFLFISIGWLFFMNLGGLAMKILLEGKTS